MGERFLLPARDGVKSPDFRTARKSRAPAGTWPPDQGGCGNPVLTGFLGVEIAGLLFADARRLDRAAIAFERHISPQSPIGPARDIDERAVRPIEPHPR